MLLKCAKFFVWVPVGEISHYFLSKQESHICMYIIAHIFFFSLSFFVTGRTQKLYRSRQSCGLVIHHGTPLGLLLPSRYNYKATHWGWFGPLSYQLACLSFFQADPIGPSRSDVIELVLIYTWLPPIRNGKYKWKSIHSTPSGQIWLKASWVSMGSWSFYIRLSIEQIGLCPCLLHKRSEHGTYHPAAPLGSAGNPRTNRPWLSHKENLSPIYYWSPMW